ncbi:hypothetical protein [Geodermatophilus sabuli]|uniref:Uncharacterized protein n=1 Tax=Geodermatophilus sabuli TaxID=1564158 RepID=A0A285EHA1_9ACTN|nr:hypothetical protein [Geodermatophilus sabuli]MBB3086115.1 hypothetical protein [Geodermatophilus sabuli]SNX98455.1 hypothetical protein SAMN06893097_110239 [Geodermatophilus sabuli]
MDSSAPAAVPWIVLGVAVLALAGLVPLLLTGRRSGARTPRPVREEPAVTPATRFPHDDLPGFLDAPPGTPPAPAAAPPPALPGLVGPDGPDGDDTRDRDDASAAGRALAAMAAVALLLIGALAAVAVGTRDDDVPAAEPPAASPPAAPTTAGTPTGTPLPELPGVPAEPLPGESGAGALADRSVPLGEDGVTATLGFGAIVVERHAVGVTVAEPVVSVTATGDAAAGDGAALAHVALPTWNCLADEPPADPERAGCVRSTTEYADLPSPALVVTRDDDALRLTGRFPSYTRPITTAPAYTGRVYELTVTVAPAGPVRDGRAVAEATLFLGTDRTTTTRDGLNVIRYAG